MTRDTKMDVMDPFPVLRFGYNLFNPFRVAYFGGNTVATNVEHLRCSKRKWSVSKFKIPKGLTLVAKKDILILQPEKG